MLQSLLTVAQKVLALFVMIGVGAVLRRKNTITEQGAQQLNGLLLNLVTPCVIIHAFQIDRETVSLKSLGLMALLAFMSLVVGILVARFCFRRRPEGQRRVMNFAVIYSNSGFMGLPLVQALLGQEGVIYASVYIAVFNVVVWTHGYAMMNGTGEKQPLKSLLLNPGTVGVYIGLPLFLLGWRLPEVLYTPVEAFSALNTPLAMLCIGVYISAVKLKQVFREKALYQVSLLRLCVVPALTLILLWLIQPGRLPFLSCVIQASAPAAGMTVILAARFQRDTVLAAEVTAMSTLLSIATMPVLTTLADLLCGG